jgi:phage shock protein A
VARKASDALKSDFRRLEEKLEEARRKRDVLVARKLAAEAQKEVASVAPAMSKAQRSYAKFDRMESKIEQMEAEAKAILELSEEQRSLDREVVDRERAAEVDAELAALKMEARKSQ